MENFNKDNQSQNINESTVSHLQINTDEVYEFIEDKQILDILESVKQAYPFTFIGRQKFRRKIDQLNFDFWIKDSNEKFVIVNSSFAKSLNRKVSEIENKSLSDILDEKEYKLVKNITEYIISSSNSVIYETYSRNNEGDLLQNVEFPICDIDDNVVAIIGFKQKAFKLENLIADNSGNQESSNIEEIPAPVVKVSSNFIVQKFSDRFYQEFNLNANSILNQSLQSIFNIDFSKLILKTTPSIIRIAKNEYSFEHKAIQNNPSNGYYFSFIKIIEKSDKAESSDKAFDMVMYTSPDPMFIYSIDNLRFLKVNDAALKFYGYREDEFLGMDLTDLYGPEDIQTLVDSASKNTIERGFTGPWRQKRKDGSAVVVEISKSGIEFNGKRAHFNVIREISGNDGEEAIKQLNSIIENSNDVIIITDADGFIKKNSKSATRVLGLSKAELDDRPFLSLVTDDYRAKVNTKIFHSAFPEVVSFECDFKKSDGEVFSAKLTATPITDSSKNVTVISIIISQEKEVVIQKVVQKEVVGAQVPVEKNKNSLDKEFLSHLFHELLTPVNVIIGFAQEIAESVEDMDSEQKESVEIIKQNQRTLLQLMDNAIQYTELEQNQVKLNPSNIHFVELIDQIESDVSKVAANLGKEFSYGKISSSLTFETDSSKLQSLSALLVEFAMRATKKEKVYLSAYQLDAGHCVVSVKDDRNAISRELLDNLTEIFKADENIVRHKYGISRFMLRFALKVSDLIALERGPINKLGEPVEFGFTFPIRFDERKIANQMVAEKVEETPVTVTEEVKVAENNEEQKQAEPITLNVNVNALSNSQVNVAPESNTKEVVSEPEVIVEEPKKVTPEKEEIIEDAEVETVEEKKIDFEQLSCLYVEDQIDSQILFKVQMKGLKTIDFANSFEKAIPLLQSRKYDFIIMDINLQGEYNGLDALRSIQKMENHKNVPIVAVTAYVLPGDRERFITAGFTDFISKPILRDKLESVLNNIF